MERRRPSAAALDAIRDTKRRKLDQVDRALAALDPSDRDVWVEWLTDEEAAEAAGITGSAHLARALSRFSGLPVGHAAVRKWRER